MGKTNYYGPYIQEFFLDPWIMNTERYGDLSIPQCHDYAQMVKHDILFRALDLRNDMPQEKRSPLRAEIGFEVARRIQLAVLDFIFEAIPLVDSFHKKYPLTYNGMLQPRLDQMLIDHQKKVLVDTLSAVWWNHGDRLPIRLINAVDLEMPSRPDNEIEPNKKQIIDELCSRLCYLQLYNKRNHGIYEEYECQLRRTWDDNKYNIPKSLRLVVREEKSKWTPSPEPLPLSTDPRPSSCEVGLQFERQVKRHLAETGIRKLKLTPSSNDKGADLLGVRNRQPVVVQCKWITKGKLSSKAVMEIFAAKTYYQATVGIVVSNALPSEPCKDMAEKLGIELIHFCPGS